MHKFISHTAEAKSVDSQTLKCLKHQSDFRLCSHTLLSKDFFHVHVDGYSFVLEGSSNRAHVLKFFQDRLHVPIRMLQMN